MKRLKYFLDYASRHKAALLLTLLLLIGDVTLATLMPWLMSELVDNGVLTGSMDTVKRTSLLMAGAALAGSVTAFLFSAVTAVLSQRINNEMRKDLFRSIHSLSYGQTDTYAAGTLLTRIMSDTQIVTQFGAAFFQMLVKPLAMFLFGFVMTLVISGKYAWIFAAAIPLQTVILILFMKRLTPLFLRIQLRIEKINSLIQETLGSMRLVKAYMHQDYEGRRFRRENDDLLGLNLEIQYTLAVMNPLIMLIINGVLIAILALSGVLARTGETDVGRIIAAIMYIQQIMMSLMVMGQIYQVTAKAAVSCERLSEIRDMEPALKDGTRTLEEPVKTLEAREVSYYYPGAEGSDRPALDRVSFSVSAGEIMGVTGPTGSGKSTLAALLNRFAEPVSGEILLNGIPLPEWTAESLGRKITAVLQKPELCFGTIADNIRYGLEGATEEDIRRAAHIAGADVFIDGMPEGYGTEVTQRGASLSGGQKQCIALARALLRRPEVLILDDSTSSMDLITEDRFYERLAEACPGITLIIVSQRIHTILRADRILLMEDGRISAAGRHAELLEQSGLYREICRSQEIGEVCP